MAKYAVLTAAGCCLLAIPVPYVCAHGNHAAEHFHAHAEQDGDEDHDHDHDHDHEGEDHDHDAHLAKLSSEQIQAADIQVKRAGVANIQRILTLPGIVVVDADHYAHVVSKVSGIVTKINKGLGEKVEEGEVVALLESKEMAEAKAAYLTAFKKAELAQIVLKAEQSLKDKQISAQQDYWQALMGAKEAEINQEMAAQLLYILGMNDKEIESIAKEEQKGLRLYEIKAPISGVVIEKAVTLGEMLQTDKEIFTIGDLDTVWVEMGIYPKDLPGVKVGKKIEVSYLHGGVSSKAVVKHLSPVIDDQTKTAQAIAALPNAERDWYPGAAVRVSLSAEEVEVPIAVRKEAVQIIDGVECVFVVHPEGFEKRAVKTGRIDSQYVEIVAGLEKDAAYAATNAFLLKAELGKGAGGE